MVMEMSYIYKGFRSYVGWMLKKTIFKSFNSMGLENVPAPGTPVLVVENHQNGICDPLGLVVSLQDRKTLVFSRADIFNKSKWMSRLLTGCGLIPAYRMDHEGIEHVNQNYVSFGRAEEMLLQGETVAIYPEGRHQGKRILGEFSSAYLRMAFEAAKASNFQKEIWILPTCNHYSNYFGLRNQAMINYGVPIALSQWYDQYKEKPRTTCNKVNRLVRGRIEEMMLNISDEAHYDDINFLCNTMNHYRHPQMKDCLPALLEADKGLCNAISQMEEEQHNKLMEETSKLREIEKQWKISDDAVERDDSKGTLTKKALIAILLFPLWIVSLWPGIVTWQICHRIISKGKDPIFGSALLLSLGGIVLMPLLSIATTILLGTMLNWWIAFAWLLILPLLTRFAWVYHKHIGMLRNDIKVMKMKRNTQYKEMQTLRKNIKSIIEEL